MSPTQKITWVTCAHHTLAKSHALPSSYVKEFLDPDQKLKRSTILNRRDMNVATNYSSSSTLYLTQIKFCIDKKKVQPHFPL
ncbi:MAG TPA: hypothetical protein DCE42_07125 [Myxococcales bacterium]|nr:hypothetical protein [Deltaproteobacteria bacterium]MBU48636.1 hypothetical protein [Deltaproteobacteria bacterium]HAA54511.1 hypothetical protein [Myxococcales bacterium]